MAAKYIFAVLSIVFLVLALARTIRSGGAAHSQSRTWFLIAVIFGVVSIYLFSQG
jgi:hypothetical protein